MRLILVLLLVTAAWADELTEIREKMGKSLSGVPVRIAEDWATCGKYLYVNGRMEAEAGVLLHKLDGRWRQALIGTPTITASRAFKFGVPHRLWSRLDLYYERGTLMAILNEGPFWKEVSERELSDGRLRSTGTWERILMRNEVFARHGYIFQDPELRTYFAQRRWYKAADRMTPLSALEKANVDRILHYDRRHPKQW